MYKYNDKRNDSFKTRYRLFLFDMAFQGSNAKKIVENPSKSIRKFEEFVIDKAVIDAYAANYYQKKYYNEKVKYKNYKELTVDEIWHCMDFEKNNLFQLTKSKNRKNITEEYLIFYTKLKESYDNIFHSLFPKDRFDEMIKSKKCSYCGISVDDISSLGQNGKLYNKRSETRGYTLEIDRKEANGEYTKDNCCMCCYWCNNAKTDEFTVEEFKEIAKGINGIWKQRLREANLPDKINFPTEVYKGEDK